MSDNTNDTIETKPEGEQDVQKLIAEAVAKETAGLKAKNADLVNRLSKAGDELKRFDGIEPDAVRAMLAKFSSEEEAALIAKGQIQQVLDNRTERMKGDFTKQLETERTATKRYQEANRKLADRALSEAIVKAASKAGALPEALDDIVLRAKASGWSVNEDGDIVAMHDGEVVIGKDGKTSLSPTEWAETLRETAPHLWPKAQGAGATGSGSGGGSGKKSITREEFDKLDPAAKQKAARELQIV